MTRQVRRQLAIFAVLTVVGLVVTGFGYARIPAMFGVGRYQVDVELADGAGLYVNANVAYRGATIGTVTALRMTASGARATLSLDSSVDVPEDSTVSVQSQSAIGEQFVEFEPRANAAPYLREGEVIPVGRTRIPAPIGPIVDRLDATLAGVAGDDLRTVIDESYTALDGAAPDLRRLVDSSAAVLGAARTNLGPLTTLIDQAAPLLDTQRVAAGSIGSWTRDLAGFTDQVRRSDERIRNLLRDGPSASATGSTLLTDLDPALAALLPSATTVADVAAVYHMSLEQILVLYPQIMVITQSAGLPNADRPAQNTYFNLELNDPPPCTTGFLPADQRRSPTALDVPVTPANLYCKLAQNNPSAVRGARNLPCIENPGRRAPTVQLCRDPEGYRPEGN
ncbi:MCE family protein [Rhodococcus spelaei]|uniref:MCE family protein n=1 Tax=Rhodococcus spelaei TaxID=2546320 RepID=A0A541BRM2_9NOCA|nr:MlaD family protein [Rhodococcus spelaei]TQF74946.1 MCE family protein [Rhodococcus spelaei]